MQAGGIVGVGDICNTTDAIAVKKERDIHWHNLIEVLNFSDVALQERLVQNMKILDGHLAAGLTDSGLTAHAPYSVTEATFSAINAATRGRVISVHNQETAAENELFTKGTGALLQLYSLTGTPPPLPSGRSSIQTWLPLFTEGQTILLVHNTYTQKEDIQFAKAHAAAHGLKLYWCLCPGANRYIEDKVPPLDLLLEEGCAIVLGTDSYSSNWQLSIAAEIRLLTHAYPKAPLEVLLQAATRNGAAALGWKHLGKLQKGPKPGLALLHTDRDGNVTGTSERVC
jgi:cytosine/adenosine deaminase-related metal-dependent hydrolase